MTLALTLLTAATVALVLAQDAVASARPPAALREARRRPGPCDGPRRND